ncbi:hypothetical protein RS3R6_09500 [Pseudomonas atacamensis]|uniref:Uncharacterized protein n=1 Tax=Pseudomonas atacamensis TaxID=2565368 RepID=A0ABQ5PMF4_9PSED|nr:hypothetical protein RS3R1_36600 [Pseudomonas atacamensis]GLH52769.1 hypothetical protein RS3R6_09500 [Pseudomonas atacamensis]
MIALFSGASLPLTQARGPKNVSFIRYLKKNVVPDSAQAKPGDDAIVLACAPSLVGRLMSGVVQGICQSPDSRRRLAPGDDARL